MYVLKFFGLDGEFEYTYGVFDEIVAVFRVPRVFGLNWTSDGDGLSSSVTVFPEANKVGNWYVSLV